MYLAHRASFLLAHGREPIGETRHTCDNRWCVNPTHLKEGSRKQNAGDAVARGRTAKGDRHGRRKLSSKQVTHLRTLHAGGGWTHQRLADKFGVSRQQVTRIVNSQNW